jgi:hypothetical protein
VTTEEIYAATAVKLWNQVLGRVNDAVASLTEEQLERRVAPNRNRVIYVVGHLIAVNDHLFPMLGLGDRLYPELDEVYLKNPDGKLPDPLSAEDLKKAWTDVHGKLTEGIETMSPAQWLERHSLVSEEDFAKDPLRNRLAVFISRTTHVSFHAGQLVLAREPAENAAQRA